MTRSSVVNKVRDLAWLIGAVTGILAFTGSKWVSGDARLTALETRVAANVEARIAALEANAPIMNALALDLCLRTADPRIRAPLECYRREAGR